MHWNSFLITLKSGWITDTEMIEALEFVSDKIGIIMGAVLGIIVVIAIIRTLLKASKGESISIPPVGVMNDLPSSVTGINKNNDMSERVQERLKCTPFCRVRL